MHKYVAEVDIIPVDEGLDKTSVTLHETTFIAVTSYQSSAVSVYTAVGFSYISLYTLLFPYTCVAHQIEDQQQSVCKRVSGQGRLGSSGLQFHLPRLHAGILPPPSPSSDHPSVFLVKTSTPQL